MKAAVLRNGRIAVEQVADAEPESGQLLARPIVCGICGSDLHARDHAPHLCDVLHRAGFRGFMNPDMPVVMGHEFCCEVVEQRGGTSSAFARGQRVVGMPFLTSREGLVLLGYSNRFNGAFAEAMVLQPEMCLAVPDHVPSEIAALTEPLSVAVHAIAEARIESPSAFCVVGCGPVGLFVIARLRALGLGPILAIEPDATRRAMAGEMGADICIEPGSAAAESWWNDLGLPLGLSDAMAVDPQLRKRARAVIFDCVGKPGILMRIATEAPVGSTIVAIGTCMETDAIEPALLLQKGLRVQFVFAYTQDDFAAAFTMICDAPDRLSTLVTGHASLHGVQGAFDTLSRGGGAIKTMIDPLAQ